ncbi:MAG: metalloregulator ArsR/SmtB family transcription factor [Lacunisphaera sp.]|nr:metalloregulator ArsR/SmtB family transcription factor [Lacunisphaera sp.]
MLCLTALADPTRRRIVELLAREEYTAGEIVAEFALSAPAISQHLKILREAGLVTVRAEGQRRVHVLNPAGFAELDVWLHRMKRTWSQQAENPNNAQPARAVIKDEPAHEPAAADDGWEIIKMENP